MDITRLTMVTFQTMERIVNVYRKDPTNIGDTVCTPTLYFDWLKDVTTMDVMSTDFVAESPALEEALVLVGGGGLVDHFDRTMSKLYTAPLGKLVLWGGGHNIHGANHIAVSPNLKNYDLVGLRDHGQGYEWVPCASCLHPAFDEEHTAQSEVILYEHTAFPLRIEGIPTLRNNATSFEEVINFLGSGEVVLTNTYHGAYWATLLGKHVIVIEPFSSKFYGLKHQHPFVTRDTWQEQLPLTRSYPLALTECRAANLAFSRRVIELYTSHSDLL